MPVFDSQNCWFKNPVGPVTEKLQLDLKICLGKNENISNVRLILILLGAQERLELPMSKIDSDCIHDTYEIQLKFDKPATYEYFFEYVDNYKQYYIRKKKYSFEGFVTQNYENTETWLITCYKQVKGNPKMKNGIMYQIFPDRFKKGETEQELPKNRRYRKWGELPFYDDRIGSDFFGGNFSGIASKINYLKRLHVNVLYLNPICLSSTNHRYASIDYQKIDPVLGTEEEFLSFIDKLHENEMILILDAVLNHVASDSVYFKSAHDSKESLYRGWFHISEDNPNDYFCWWGDKSLPKLNYSSESLKKFILGENGLLEFWYKKWHIDGIRQDVADELPNEIRNEIFKISNKEREDKKVVLPEVWENASRKWAYEHFMEYMQGSQCTSVMNYPIRDTLIPYIRYGGEYWSSEFKRVCNEIFKEDYPREIAYSLMNFISTHDTARAITRLAGPEIDNNSREWQASNNLLSIDDYKLGRERSMLAYLTIFFLPGIPSIYYGDEIGLYGMKDPFCRGCFLWDRIDKKLLKFFRNLCNLRYNNQDFLAEADFNIVCAESDILIIERSLGKKKLHICLNFSGNDRDITYLFVKKHIEKSSVVDTVIEPNVIFKVKNQTKYALIRGTGDSKRAILSARDAIVYVEY